MQTGLNPLQILSPGGPDFVKFTSTGYFIVPAGVTTVFVTIVGAGGGGGNVSATPATYGGGGGGGGYVENSPVAVLPGQQVLVTIGAGGVPTGNGGTTSFGNYIIVTGGGGGTSGPAGVAGTAGSPYGGQYTGGLATLGAHGYSSGVACSAGWGTAAGCSGDGTAESAGSSAVNGLGGGGGGASTANGTARSGGYGASGWVFIQW